MSITEKQTNIIKLVLKDKMSTFELQQNVQNCTRRKTSNLEIFDSVLVIIKKILGKQEFDYDREINHSKKQFLEVVGENTREISK